LKSFLDFLEEELKAQSGTQMGSNEGGIHHDEDGVKHYVKYYKNGDQAKTEALTGNLYHHMGIHTIQPKYHNINGKHAIVSKYNDNLEVKHPKFYDKVSKEHAHHLGKMYHAAVATKNWDIVGLEHDNIMHDKKKGHLVSIDHGGAFNFRAQGGHKDFGSDTDEKESLRQKHLPSGHVFNSAFHHHPEAEEQSKKELKASVDHKHVKKLFKDSGLSNWKDLHKGFTDRLSKL
jgi:hypothetical protein